MTLPYTPGEKVDSFLDRLRDQFMIHCPYCKAKFDISYFESEDLPISYNGEDSSGTLNCPDCDTVFGIEEHVERTYTTTALKGEIDG